MNNNQTNDRRFSMRIENGHNNFKTQGLLMTEEEFLSLENHNSPKKIERKKEGWTTENIVIASFCFITYSLAVSAAFFNAGEVVFSALTYVCLPVCFVTWLYLKATVKE